MEKLLILQPHSDDVMFSASQYLFDKKEYKSITILTVEYNEKRIQEDIAVCNHFGVELITLKSRVDSTNFHKEYYSKYTSMDDKTALKFCENKIGKEKLSELWDELETLIKKYKLKGYTIITCLGVGHPFHWLTRIMTEELSDLFYRDFPHSYKRRNQAYFNGLVASKFRLTSVSTPKRNHDEKMRLIAQFYKTQSSLLFFEKGYINKRLPEEFYEKA